MPIHGLASHLLPGQDPWLSYDASDDVTAASDASAGMVLTDLLLKDSNAISRRFFNALAGGCPTSRACAGITAGRPEPMWAHAWCGLWTCGWCADCVGTQACKLTDPCTAL
jgi:hypothetical protein